MRRKFTEKQLRDMKKEGLHPSQALTKKEIEEARRLDKLIRAGKMKLYPHPLPR